MVGVAPDTLLLLDPGVTRARGVRLANPILFF